MTSIRTLWRLECRRFGRDAVSWLSAAIVLVTGVAAIGFGEARFSQRLQQQAEIRAAEDAKVSRLRARAQMLGTAATEISPRELTLERAWGARTPGYANAWTQLSALQQPMSLSVLTAGVSDLYSTSYGTSWRDVEPEPRPLDPREPTLTRAGWFDLSFVVLYLMPIAILLNSQDLVAQEREAGTWMLVRSSPISLSRILVLKLAPRIALIAGCLAALGVLAAWRTGDLVGVLAWQTVAVAYATFWFASAVLISLSVRDSSTAAAGGFAGWFIVAIVLPAALDAGLARGIPAPTEHELTMAARAARTVVRFDSSEAQAEAALLAADGQARQMRAAFLARYPQFRDAEGLSSWGRYGIVQAAKEEALDAVVAPIRQQKAEAADRRETWMARLSVVSPTLVTSRALWRLANVDPRAQAEFHAQARAYDRQWKAFFWPLMFTGADFSPDHYDRIPRFVHRLPTRMEQLSTSGFASLLLLTQAAVVAAFVWHTTWRDDGTRW
jgi:ABC-2 type transport system permease protein